MQMGNFHPSNLIFQENKKNLFICVFLCHRPGATCRKWKRSSGRKELGDRRCRLVGRQRRTHNPSTAPPSCDWFYFLLSMTRPGGGAQFEAETLSRTLAVWHGPVHRHFRPRRRNGTGKRVWFNMALSESFTGLEKLDRLYFTGALSC